MKYLMLLPLAVQGLAILVDEFYFHLARGLPRWERIGHPAQILTQSLPSTLHAQECVLLTMHFPCQAALDVTH